MSDFILKTCVQLLLHLADTMNEQDKFQLIRKFAGAIRFGVIGLTVAALIIAIRWW